MTTAGYSGTPLSKKLGIKAGYRLLVFNAPKPYAEFFEILPEDVEEADYSDGKVDFIHIFATTSKELAGSFAKAKPALKMDGCLWISWPKKASTITSEIDKFDVMKLGQEGGLVDVKVAAIDDDWSGHKFMYRVKDRK